MSVTEAVSKAASRASFNSPRTARRRVLRSLQRWEYPVCAVARVSAWQWVIAHVMCLKGIEVCGSAWESKGAAEDMRSTVKRVQRMGAHWMSKELVIVPVFRTETSE